MQFEDCFVSLDFSSLDEYRENRGKTSLCISHRITMKRKGDNLEKEHFIENKTISFVLEKICIVVEKTVLPKVMTACEFWSLSRTWVIPTQKVTTAR